jgi:hypothetical protein
MSFVGAGQAITIRIVLQAGDIARPMCHNAAAIRSDN